MSWSLTTSTLLPLMTHCKHSFIYSASIWKTLSSKHCALHWVGDHFPLSLSSWRIWTSTTPSYPQKTLSSENQSKCENTWKREGWFRVPETLPWKSSGRIGAREGGGGSFQATASQRLWGKSHMCGLITAMCVSVHSWWALTGVLVLCDVVGYNMSPFTLMASVKQWSN